jgi:hypothetical protein
MWWTAPAPGDESPYGDRCDESHEELSTMQIATIGLDLAKHVFQVHGIDAAEKVVIRKQFRRGQVLKFFEALSPCLIGMEACASAHYWARELTKFGHTVRLMPAKDGLMSGATRTTRPMPRRSARRFAARACDLWESNRPISRVS